MSATSSVPGSKVSIELSEQDFPKLPGAVPNVIGKINELHGLILATQKISTAHARERELGDQVRQLTALFTTLHHVAEEVAKSATPFFDKSRGQKGPWDSKVQEKQARLNAMSAIKELDRVLKEQVSAEVSFPAVSVTPNFLPRVEGLSSELDDLSQSLQSVMADALNPSKPTDVLALKKLLTDYRVQFEELGSQAQNLKEPVSKRADALDKFIEDTRMHMATTWISKTICDWQLARIDIFANCFTNLEALQQTMAGVTQENENLKQFLRENTFKPVDHIKLKFDKILQESGDLTIKEISSDITVLLELYPDTAPALQKNTLKELLAGKPETKVSDASLQIKSVLAKLAQSSVDEAKRQFDSVKRRYDECKALTEQYRPEAERTIKDLDAMIGKAEKTLVNSIEEIPFHYESVRDEVLKQMRSSIGDIQGQRKTLLYKLKDLWKQIHDQFTTDRYDHLFYEINRQGYAIFENSGNVPRDTTYGMMGFGWYVANRYVTALATEETQ